MTIETIAAIATAAGEAGIGIVRASGPNALSAALTLFRRPGLPHPPETHHAYYGQVVRPGREERLDECVLTFFRGPHSYTGEDVVELACHGSGLVLTRVLQGLLGAGARLAEPGEFTQRAFFNGRLDLAAAESVIDVIRARTDAALRVATGQLSGRLSREIAGMRGALIGLLAEIEAGIDFSDEIDPPADEDVARRSREVRAQVEALLSTADAGRLYREGAALVLAGCPNVGKSSLLNALLGEDRAIVTHVPGTTRDVIEELLNLRGIPVRAIDTAGLRDTGDLVESLGVERTHRQLEAADLVLWIVDASEGITGPEPPLEGKRVLRVGNKVDLGDRLPADDPAIRISAATGQGLEHLETAIVEALGADHPPDTILVSNVRHQEKLRAAATALDRAIDASDAGFDQAAVALDLKQAAEALGEITGETVTEETITQIFARFCVGK